MKEPELTLSCCPPLRIWVLVILSRLQIVGISKCWSFYCLCKFWIWVLIHACVPAKLQISVFFSNEFCDAAKVSDHPYEDVGKWQSFIGRFSPNLAIKPDIYKSQIFNNPSTLLVTYWNQVQRFDNFDTFFLFYFWQLKPSKVTSYLKF